MAIQKLLSRADVIRAGKRGTRGGATGAFGRAALKVSKKVRRAAGAAALGATVARKKGKKRKNGLSGKAQWIKRKFGTSLTPAERKRANRLWIVMLEKRKKELEKKANRKRPIMEAREKIWKSKIGSR